MADPRVLPPRLAPAIALPPCSYVPGHGLPHPVNDPAGHLFKGPDSFPEPPGPAVALAALPADPVARRRAVAATIVAAQEWAHALDLFNHGFYWEAHEAWEGWWHALGRTSPEARLVQGLIHLAAAAVKIREGKPGGVQSHARRARELLGLSQAGPAEAAALPVGTLGLTPHSVSAVLAELDRYRPQCWHTSRFPVVKVLATSLQAAG